VHRLAELQGFRWFSLLRRIDAEYTDYKAEGAFGNYISLTVWEDKVTAYRLE
jgi:heme-degrading monooxygenase HmoA